jgi:hypothetical protein
VQGPCGEKFSFLDPASLDLPAVLLLEGSAPVFIRRPSWAKNVLPGSWIIFAGITVTFPSKSALEKMRKSREFLNGLSDEKQAFSPGPLVRVPSISF